MAQAVLKRPYKRRLDPTGNHVSSTSSEWRSFVSSKGSHPHLLVTSFLRCYDGQIKYFLVFDRARLFVLETDLHCVSVFTGDHCYKLCEALREFQR